MDTTKLIEKLNDCLKHEWTGVAQYAQAGFLAGGILREVYAPKFYDSAEECFTHAKQVGEKISAMGGVPTVERNPVKQSSNIEELLENALEFESTAVEHYNEALALAEGDRALVVFLEDILKEEQEGVDELTLILRELSSSSAAGSSSKAG